MFQLQRKSGALAWLLAMLMYTGAAWADESVTFRLPLDGKLEPSIAAGDPRPTYIGDADESLQWEQGIFGQGLLTGAPGQAVRFAAAGNFPQNEGTLSFWMRGLPGARWHERDGQMHNFFMLMGGGGWLRLYKYHAYNYTFLLSQVTDEDGNRRQGRINLPRYREDTWNFFAFTWTASGRVSFYLNGRFVAQQDDFPLPVVTANSQMRIGQWDSEGDSSRVIDDFVIRDRALSGYDIAQLYHAQGDFRLAQTVVVPRIAGPIEIDGHLDEPQWQQAAVVPLAIHQWRPTDTVSYVQLAYDQEHLYVALRSPLPQAVLDEPDQLLLRGFYKRDVLVDDEGVNHDDAFEINLFPNWQVEGRADLYSLITNTINTRYDYIVRGDGQVDLPWDPQWVVASQVSLEGWTLEARIPFAGLEVPTPSPGDVWQANFHRIWKLLRDQRDSWTMGRRDPESGQAGRYTSGWLTFGGGDAVTARVNRLQHLNREQAQLALELMNHGELPRDVRVVIRTDRHVVVDEIHTLAGTDREAMDLQIDLRASLPVSLRIQVSDPAQDRVYYDAELPLYAKQQFDVVLRSYPSLGMIKLEADTTALGVSTTELRGQVRILQGEQAVQTVPLRAASIFLDQTVDISGLAPGEYVAEITFQQGDRVLATQQLTFDKQPMPTWFGNQLGITDQAPQPWTAVQWQADKQVVEVWNRTYRYGGRLLPGQITAGGYDLLSGPMTLMLTTASGESVDLTETTDSPGDVHQVDARVSWKQSSEHGQIRTELSSYVEFDGMSWVELTLRPQAGAVEVDSLILTIPMQSCYASLINPYDYSLATTGALSQEGWAGNLRPVWLGSETVGIQFFAESSHNWHVANRRRELEVVRHGDEVLFKVNLIDQPLVLSEPRTFALGFQATPVKPMHPEHRRWRIGHPPTVAELTPEKNVEVLAAWTTRWGVNSPASGEIRYPIPHPNLTAQRLTSEDEQGRAIYRFPYYQLHEAWTQSQQYEQFGDEWLRNVRQVYRPGSSVPVNDRKVTVCQNARSLQDFVLWGFDQLHDQAAPRGYYFDVSRAGNCNNAHHGCGYVQGGQYQTTFNILGAREMAKRIYVHLKQRNPDGMIIYHASGQIVSALHGFADIIVDGENHYSQLDRRNNRGYENFLTLDTYRAEYMGHNIGSSVALLLQFTRSGSIRAEEKDQVGPQPLEYVLGLPLLHDSQWWIAYYYDKDVVRQMYEGLDSVNFAGTDWTFLPYWNQQVTQPLDESDAVASFYLDGQTGRALAVVMNMAGQPRDLRLTLDPQALGFTPTSVRNLNHSEAVELQESGLVIPGIPSHAYRMLLLSAK